MREATENTPMIPEYPKFAKLDISHQTEFEEVLNGIEPYSEFSFPCIYSWDTEESTYISKIHGNILIRMPDYITGEPFISILGKSINDDIIDLLVDTYGELKLVPEAVIEQMTTPEKFHIVPDRDQFDYVFSLDQLINLPGKHFKGRRNKSGRFVRIHGENLEIKKVDFNNSNQVTLLMETFSKWQSEKQKTDAEVAHEKKALLRILENSSHFKLVGIIVCINGECIGFSVNEVVADDFAMSRFQKTLLSFNNLDVLLSSIVAGELKHFGCDHVSWEQDLGIEGLRQYKSSFQPERFLKKYTISLI